MNFNMRYEKLSWLVPIISLIILWEIIGRMGLFPVYLFPSFTKVLNTLYLLVINGLLLDHFLASLLRVLAGFSIGLTTGLLFGILMGYYEKIYKMLHPIFSLLMPIPALGWLPLLILWIGLSEALPITLIFLCSFFPVLYNTITGIRQVDKECIDVARSLGAKKMKVFLTVVLPLASQNIFTGIRLEAGMAWRTVVAAEMIAIPTGIGALMINSQYLIRVDIIMVCLGVLAVMSMLIEKFVIWLEDMIIKWR